MGRKAKAAGEKLDARIQVLFTTAEATQLKERAQAQGTTASALIRATMAKEKTSETDN